MDCPKCKAEMEFGMLDGMRIERCPQCLGIWFRKDEHKSLRKAKGAELIDIGPAELGRDFDAAHYVPCPECAHPMNRVAEPSQPHIAIESCVQGHGVFFDAGEYRDFQERSVGDLFKRLFA